MPELQKILAQLFHIAGLSISSLRLQWVIRGLCQILEGKAMMCESGRMESTSPSTTPRDRQCPVCLQTVSFPVQTNCGHVFCAPCLMAYWRHGTWLDPISCPLCRQKVSVLQQLFEESRLDRHSKEVFWEITNYNKRYSGAPRRITDYLCDAPLLLQLLVRGLGTRGGLVWMFLIRVALCFVGTVVSISSPSLETVPPSTSPLEADPPFSGLLGVLDDMVVVILLLICIINIQQVAPDRRLTSNDSSSHGLVENSLLDAA